MIKKWNYLTYLKQFITTINYVESTNISASNGFNIFEHVLYFSYRGFMAQLFVLLL